MPASASTCFCCRRIILPGEPVWMDGFFEETWHEACAGLARLLDPDGGERRQPVPLVAP